MAVTRHDDDDDATAAEDDEGEELRLSIFHAFIQYVRHTHCVALLPF